MCFAIGPWRRCDGLTIELVFVVKLLGQMHPSLLDDAQVVLLT